MAFGVTPNGFVPKRLSDIKLEIEEALRAALGNGINLLPESVLGQIVGIFSERESLIWELAESVYNSQYPSTSEGTSLDNVVSLNGLVRLNAIASVVKTGVAYGVEGTLIRNGFIVSVENAPDLKFQTIADYVIGPGVGGSDPFIDNIELVALNPGKVIAPAGSLNVIETPVAGVTSFTNLEDAIIGREIETDEELRIRRNISLQMAGAGPLEAIGSRLRNLENVEAVVMFENINLAIDMYGRPGKSFESVILGGDEDEIAETIWLSKPAGIESYGQISKTIYDSHGNTHTIKFSRPIEDEIYLELDLATDIKFPTGGETLVKAAIIDYAETLSIGDDIIVFPKLISSLNDIPGIIDIVVRIGLNPDPISDDNIVIDPTHISRFDTSRIEVNIL